MSMESLLINTVTEMFGGGRVEGSDASDLPTGAPSHVHLPKPGEAMKAVRARLAELKKEEQKELQDKAEELRKEIQEERDIAAAGDFNLKLELEKGTSREELAQMRAAGEIAHGVVVIKEEQLDGVQDQIDRISRRWSTKSSQVMNAIQRTEAAYMTYLQAFCGGDRQAIRMNADRQARALKVLLSVETNLRAALDDDDLVDSVMTEITTFDVPKNYVDLLWFFITDRDKKEHFNDVKPTINNREQ